MSLRYATQGGFALPTVVIASVVMLMILVTTVGAVSSARVALDAQFDEQRLKDAAESGAARAQDCIGNATMTLNVIVTPATNCDGTAVGGPGRSPYITGASTGSTFRTSYEIKLTDNAAQSKKVAIVGKIDSLRKSDASVMKSKTLPLTQNATMVLDPSGDRISQRYWYFGDQVVMDFGVDGSAMPTFSVNPSAAATSYEGTTVVTGEDGNLDFWTNGLTIWDKTGAVMSNSTGLSGSASATQAVASFPMNAARTQYGVVSNKGQGETGYAELYLSIVDMNANGGLGAVTTKNQRLGGTGYSGEALGAMPNSDGTGYYVYSFNHVTGLITYFLIKTTGAVTGPFTLAFSPAPLKCGTFPSGSPNNETGYGSINFSKDYKRMLVTVGTYTCTGANANDNGTIYLYNMNTATGAPSLQAAWTSSGWNGTGGGSHGAYTSDFSPQEKYVYVGQIYPGMLTRYDISDPTSAAIKASEWPISFDTTDTDPIHIREGGAHIRRGPDGRMWIADRAISYYPIAYQSAPASTPCKMSYINAPDSATESVSGIGLKLDAITLPAGACSIWGLPQMATVFKPKIVLY